MASKLIINVIDYVLCIGLHTGKWRYTSQSNNKINGNYFGSDVTFTVSLSLRCWTDFYGPDCSIYCYPANSSKMGH